MSRAENSGLTASPFYLRTFLSPFGMSTVVPIVLQNYFHDQNEQY
jgi:hypothetical protein